MNAVAERHSATVTDGKQKTLTDHERSLFQECEEKIRTHMETYKEAGSALLQIRELRLYREAYVSFDEYARAKWGMTKTQANRLIAASKVSEDLAKTLKVPESREAVQHLTESAIRPLVMLTPAKRVQVMKRVIKEAPTARAITAAQITAVAREVAPQAFVRRGTKPEAKRRPEGDLVRRSEVLSAINKWAKSKDLNKMSPRQILTGVKDIIRSL